MRKKFKFIHFIILMIGLCLIFPLIAFYLGDDLIMDMARYNIRQGDVSQAMTYYDRLESFFPQSSRIPEERFYRAGLLLQKDSYPGLAIFRFSGSTDKLQKPGMVSAPDARVLMEPDYSQSVRGALDIFVQLSKDISGDGKTGWIRHYIPWLEAKCYYELGDSDRAAKLLEGINFDSPEASWPLAIRARIMLDRGDYEDVREMVDEFMDKTSQPGQGMTAELYELEGDAYLAEGIPDEALNCYEKAKSFVPEQFSWLKHQRYIKVTGTELSQESLLEELDEKIAQVDQIKSPSKLPRGQGVSGRITENGRPVIGRRIFMADSGDDINFSGRYPTVDYCCTDAGGNFYFSRMPEDPVFGIGLPAEKARASSLSVKKVTSEQDSFYELSIVPRIDASAEAQDAGGEDLVHFSWDAVSGAQRYDISLIPPEKEPRQIFVSSVSTAEVKESAGKIRWQMPQAGLMALKPNPSSFEDIKPYNILGPLYPGAGSFIYIKAYDGDNNLLSDSMGFSTWDRLLSESSGKGSAEGAYAACNDMSEGDTFAAKGLFLHAAEKYEQELGKDPGNKEILEKLTRLYLWAPGVKDPGKAAGLLDKWGKSDDLGYRRLSAELLFQQGNAKEAQSLFEAMKEKGEMDPSAYHILAEIYLRHGDYDSSTDSYKKVFEMTGQKLTDYSPITAACLKGDFDRAYILANGILFDGQRFFDVLEKARSESYPPDVMSEFEIMLAHLTAEPSKDAETAFEMAYKNFTKTYPQHQELSDLAFKLAFNRFN